MKAPVRRSPRAQRGVAMIEVLVSVLLFSLGILGLIGLQARAITLSVEAEDRNRAAMLANEIASAMWLSNNAVVDTNAGTPSWATRVKSELGNSALVDVVTEATIPNARSANITITWSPPQRSATESASSQLTTRVTLPPPAP